MPLDEDFLRDERTKHLRKLLRSAQSHLVTLHHAAPSYLRSSEVERAKLHERFPELGETWESMVTPELARDIDIRINVMADAHTYRAVYKWFDDAQAAAERYLSDQRFARYTALGTVTQLNTADHDGPSMEERLAALLDDLDARMRVFVEQLREDGEHEDTAPALRDAQGGWPHLRGVVADAVLDGYLKQMRARGSRSEISAAIGAAKEVVEATMKAQAARHAVEPAKTQPDLQDWWKALRPFTVDDSIEKALGGREGAVAKLVSGQVQTIQALGELRNQVGTGHGRAKHPAGLKPAHALLAIDLAHSVTRYLTASDQPT